MLRILGITVLAAVTAYGANPVEIGTINWGRDIEKARKDAKASGKPIFLLFQEVPGCAGCKDFGKTVLSNPVLKKAVEQEFEPVVIYNNRKGMDDEVRKAFGEPAWNYQVVRFLDAEGKDLIPRKDKVWTLDAVTARMRSALLAAKRPVPKYMQMAALEKPVKSHPQVAFAMACFWTGEAKLGALKGVVETEAGWLESREVTRVTYDPKVISFSELVSAAKKARCAQKVYVKTRSQKTAADAAGIGVGVLSKDYRVARPSDQKRQLGGLSAGQLKDLTPLQLTKLNAFWRTDRDRALEWLTPSQRARF